MDRRFSQALCIGVAVALLAACGGSQMATEGTYSEASGQRLPSHGGRSWMAAEAKRSALIYATDGGASVAYVYSFPNGKMVGELTGFKNPMGECADKKGNIWIADSGHSQVVEYTHGGTTPIASLSLPGSHPSACSVDPVTGNLAVLGMGSQLAIYENAQGVPTFYSSTDYAGFWYCTYDDNGNLFLSGVDPVGQPLAVLPSGASQISQFPVDQTMLPGSIQWDGSDLAVVELRKHSQHSPQTVYRVVVSGSTGTVVSTLQLVNRHRWFNPRATQYWVAGNRMVGPGMLPHSGGDRVVSIWPYPAGGKPDKTVQPDGSEEVWGVAVSPKK